MKFSTDYILPAILYRSTKSNLRRGLPKEQAAFKTWTGRFATGVFNFDQVDITETQDDEFEVITAYFSKRG